MHAALPDDTRLGPVTLAVRNVERALAFYRDLAGLTEHRTTGDGAASASAMRNEDGRIVTLGAGGAHVVRLKEEPAARPSPERSSGLYHTAIRYPDRATLAWAIRRILDARYPLTGASDHGVSEAFYLDDPDGHGVELYADRPRERWRWAGNMVEMVSKPLDFDSLLAEAEVRFDGAPEGTVVGHVHLRVSSIEEAERFYCDVVGFAVTARLANTATFMAAGGYHHHIGANIWQSRGAPAAGRGYVGLRELTIIVPASGGVAAFIERAEGAGVAVARESDGSAVASDPWEHRVRVVAR
jgi:catechol 2,3-dioxygenase